MAIRTFEQWIDGIFDHPLADPAWHWHQDADHCVEEDETNVDYLERLFTYSDRLLRRFDNAQVCQGLNLIASSSCSFHGFTITGGRAPWPARQRAIRAIYELNARCFARRCAVGLSHCEEIDNPLNYACYMWWEMFSAPMDPDEEVGLREVQEYIDVMERCLSIDHQACQEGALHGLGHAQMYVPERVEPIIDRFLAQSDLWPTLRFYAERARLGNIQ